MGTWFQVWRTSFGLGMIPLLFMIYFRVFRLKESAVWRASLKDSVKRGPEFAALFKHYWHRRAWHMLDAGLSLTSSVAACTCLCT